MKNARISAAAVMLAVSMILTLNEPVIRAADFSGLDTETADAGASLALAGYFETHEDAAEQIAAALAPVVSIMEEQNAMNCASGVENSEELLYENRIVGKVCTEGTLNVRESTSTLSAVLARVVRKMEVWVIGEKTVNGTLWYKVQLDDVTGYVSAAYIKFGQDAEDYFVAAREAFKEQAELPASFTIPDDCSYLESSTRQSLEYYAEQINYCLGTEYAEQKAQQNYLNMYSVLIYLLENYQGVLDIANENGLVETAYQANADITLVEFMREKLSDQTGQSEQDFVNEISAAIQSSIEESKAADAAYQASLRASLGCRIADFAAGYIGRLPYVWGGASLSSGADCSGFCGQVYASFGLLDQASANMHAYNSTSLRSVGHGIDLSQIQPGDLVCYPGHVAIYYGDGIVVHEPAPGRCAEYGNLHMNTILAVRRLF